MATNDTKPVALDVKSANSIFEHLGKAFNELESHIAASENKVQWQEVEEYFHNCEIFLTKGFNELEEKEKAFEAKKSETCTLIAEKEAAVAAKEQAFIDRVQVLKDAAVAAIAEERAKCKTASPEPVDVATNSENKVTNSFNGDPNSPVLDPEESSPYRSGERAMGVEVQPRPELTQFCEQMDAKGLLNFIMDNRKLIPSIREEIPVALKSATEPARLVLDSLEGFYPSDQVNDHENKRDASLQAMRRSCVMLLESVAPLLIGSEPDKDNPLSLETKQQAKAIADDWKPRLAEADVDAANGYSLEAAAFLQLLVTFRILSEFDEEELCKLVLTVARCRQASELCSSLGLTHKMPGIIQGLINSGKLIDAVHIVQGFKLTESFPPVPLLKTYLKDLRRNSQVKNVSAGGAANVQNDGNAQELAALKSVIKCVVEYKLQADYPLEPLHKRLAQLEKSKADKKRMGDAVKHQQPKRARANGGHYGPRMSAATMDMQPAQVYGERDPYMMGVAERYSHPAPSTYDYQMSNQSTYGHQPPTRSHYYPQAAHDDRVNTAAPYSTAPTTYGASPTTYSAPPTIYGAAPTTYGGGYTTSGVQPSHQPYM